MSKGAFFDRDGTLINDVGYLSSLRQVVIVPGIIRLCLDLQKNGYSLFVVSNQSGVARGFFDEKFVQQTHLHLASIFKKSSINFQKFYYCPHHKEAKILEYKKDCECRKPKPGMLVAAAKEFGIDLSASLMFGDKYSDVEAGNAVGCQSFLIQKILNSSK